MDNFNLTLSAQLSAEIVYYGEVMEQLRSVPRHPSPGPWPLIKLRTKVNANNYMETRPEGNKARFLVHVFADAI